MALETLGNYTATALPYIGAAGGAALGAYGGGPIGALKGASIGYGLGGQFGGAFRPADPRIARMQGTQEQLVGQMVAPYPEALRQGLSQSTQYGGESPETQDARQQFLQQTLMQPSTPTSLIGGAIGPMLPGLGRFLGEQVSPYLGYKPEAFSGAGEHVGGLLQNYIRGKTQQPEQMANIRQRLLEQMGTSPSGAYDPASFEPIRERAMRDFRQRVLPGIEEAGVAAGAEGGSSATTGLREDAEERLLMQLAALEAEHRESASGTEERRRTQLSNLLAGQQEVGLKGMGLLSKEDLARRELQQGGLKTLSELELGKHRIAGEGLGITGREDIEREKLDLERKAAQGKAWGDMLKGKSSNLLESLMKHTGLTKEALLGRFDQVFGRKSHMEKFMEDFQKESGDEGVEAIEKGGRVLFDKLAAFHAKRKGVAQ